MSTPLYRRIAAELCDAISSWSHGCCPRNDFGSRVGRWGGCHPVYGRGQEDP
jgi:hypothetical protein